MPRAAFFRPLGFTLKSLCTFTLFVVQLLNRCGGVWLRERCLKTTPPYHASCTALGRLKWNPVWSGISNAVVSLGYDDGFISAGNRSLRKGSFPRSPRMPTSLLFRVAIRFIQWGRVSTEFSSGLTYRAFFKCITSYCQYFYLNQGSSVEIHSPLKFNKEPTSHLFGLTRALEGFF